MLVSGNPREAGQRRAGSTALLPAGTVEWHNQAMGNSVTPIGTQIVIILVFLVGLGLPAVLCSVIAARKGYNSLVFLLLGLLASFIGLIVAMVIPSRHEQVTVGGMTRMHQEVTLDDGRHLPRGLLAKVSDMRIDPGTSGEIVVCQIEDPLGERHWVARSVLVPA